MSQQSTSFKRAWKTGPRISPWVKQVGTILLSNNGITPSNALLLVGYTKKDTHYEAKIKNVIVNKMRLRKRFELGAKAHRIQEFSISKRVTSPDIGITISVTSVSYINSKL